MKSRIGGWIRFVGPVLIIYSVVGLLVEAAVPQFLPEEWFDDLRRRDGEGWNIRYLAFSITCFSSRSSPGLQAEDVPAERALRGMTAVTPLYRTSVHC